MGFLIDLKSLFGKKLIPIFVWLYLYCFLFSLESNWFICSYLSCQLSNLEDNIIFFLSTLTLYVFFLFFKNNLYIKNKTVNYLNLNYWFNLLKYQKVTQLLTILYSLLTTIIFNTLSYTNNNTNFNFFYTIYIKIKNCTNLWYPIYKSYSIFGFYKSTRLKFIDLKNENLKRLKY